MTSPSTLDAERRKRIHAAYVSLLPDGFKTTRCVQYVKRNHRTISHFLDTATGREIAILEGLLFNASI